MKAIETKKFRKVVKWDFSPFNLVVRGIYVMSLAIVMSFLIIKEKAMDNLIVFVWCVIFLTILGLITVLVIREVYYEEIKQ